MLTKDSGEDSFLPAQLSRQWISVGKGSVVREWDVVIYRLVKNPECKACWGVSQVGSRLQRVLCKSRDKMCREQELPCNCPIRLRSYPKPIITAPPCSN
eukprot:sb/3478693/